MKIEEVYKIMQLLKRDKRFDVFVDIENLGKDYDRENLPYMILEHIPYQPVQELRLQGLIYMGFITDGYYHFHKKVYPVEIFA